MEMELEEGFCLGLGGVEFQQFEDGIELACCGSCYCVSCCCGRQHYLELGGGCRNSRGGGELLAEKPSTFCKREQRFVVPPLRL